MRSRQVSFLPKTELAHGGDLRKGKRKTARPLDPRRPLHVTLRSSRARGQWSLLRTGLKGRLHALLVDLAERNGIRVYRYANVGNHLHLLVSFRSRSEFQRFLRSFAGRAAILATGARKGRAVNGFWDKLAYSRVVGWGLDFLAVGRYLTKNFLEGEGSGRERYVLKPLPS